MPLIRHSPKYNLRYRAADMRSSVLKVGLQQATSCSPVVGVERPEDVLTELVGVALREETRVDLEELGPRQLTARAVSLHVYQSVSYLLN